jgi:predicted TIM-barrel fold metal-dependent hydrolase
MFMLLEVPLPVWYTSIGNWSWWCPAMIVSAACTIASATAWSRTFSSALAAAADFLIRASASSLLALGADHILFATDYPFESIVDACTFIEQAPISETDREKIMFRNAVSLLHLDTQNRN